jgi:hypothetical protein
LIFSTGPKWDGTIDEKAYNPAAAPWFHPNEEAVFGFKDGGAAVFDEFGIYIPEARQGSRVARRRRRTGRDFSLYRCDYYAEREVQGWLAGVQIPYDFGEVLQGEVRLDPQWREQHISTQASPLRPTQVGAILELTKAQGDVSALFERQARAD